MGSKTDSYCLFAFTFYSRRGLNRAGGTLKLLIR